MQNLNLKSLKERAIKIFLILILLSSCKAENKDVQSIDEEYFYRISYTDSSRIEYSFRKYQFEGDTIKLEVKNFNSMGEVIPSSSDGDLIIDENSIRLLKGNKIGEVVYNTKKQDSCWEYFHPYYHQMKNCYKGLTTNGEEYVFSSEQLSDDGISRILYLDKNYSLVRETSDSPLEKFREMVRVDKSEIPSKVLENVN